MGLITLLRNALGMHKGDPHEAPREERPVRAPRIEIYGPRGMRQFVRTIFTLTHTRSADQYCVHELLMPGETASASGDNTEELHPSEEPGTDIPCDADGYWREVTSHKLHGGTNHVVVDAGPIVHRGNSGCARPRLAADARNPRSLHWLHFPRGPETVPHPRAQRSTVHHHTTDDRRTGRHLGPVRAGAAGGGGEGRGGVPARARGDGRMDAAARGPRAPHGAEPHGAQRVGARGREGTQHARDGGPLCAPDRRRAPRAEPHRRAVRLLVHYVWCAR